MTNYLEPTKPTPLSAIGLEMQTEARTFCTRLVYTLVKPDISGAIAREVVLYSGASRLQAESMFNLAAEALGRLLHSLRAELPAHNEDLQRTSGNRG
jgi:hypothetical protein